MLLSPKVSAYDLSPLKKKIIEDNNKDTEFPKITSQTKEMMGH